MKIGLLSDTHGWLDERVFHHFEDCDEVWHAGDFGEGVHTVLKDAKPFRGVYGNIDSISLRNDLPEYIFFEVDRLKVLMIHIGGYPGRYKPMVKKRLLELKPDLYIYLCSGCSAALPMCMSQRRSERN